VEARRAVIACILGCSAVLAACAGLLDVQDVAYQGGDGAVDATGVDVVTATDSGDAEVPTDAPPPDAPVGADAQPRDASTPGLHVVKCGANEATPKSLPDGGSVPVCAAGKGCCFQFGGAAPPDLCTASAAACPKVDAAARSFFLECTDPSTCNGGRCCLTTQVNDPVSSRCTAVCSNQEVELCTFDTECAPPTKCSGIGTAYGLDPFDTFCK
jgi:hypothetical protein